MAEIEVINERPITLVETREIIDKIEKRDKELNERSNKTLEYINKVVKKSENIKELMEKLEKLEIARLKDRHIIKLIDVHPKDLDSLKTIISGENITLKQEDLKRILECLK
ncbi:MAG: hypothetical protein AABW46_01730 [Nanoarchaeota archaeon]